MELMETIEKRRSYRALDPVEIDNETIRKLAYAASRAPSCFNNQPWRFIFVKEKKVLDQMKDALSDGNYWGKRASMIIAVLSREDLDCRNSKGEYNWMDTGMALGNLLLRATDLGLVTHPIAGFSGKKTRKVLSIPDEYQLLTLIIVGKRSDELSLLKEDWQREGEKKRSERKPLKKIFSVDRFEIIEDQ